MINSKSMYQITIYTPKLAKSAVSITRSIVPNIWSAFRKKPGPAMQACFKLAVSHTFSKLVMTGARDCLSVGIDRKAVDTTTTVEQFVRLLKKSGERDIDKDIISSMIITSFAQIQQLVALGHPYGARKLYFLCKMAPNSSTKVKLREYANLAMSGRYDIPGAPVSLFMVNDIDTREPKILKFGTRVEEQNCIDLNLAAAEEKHHVVPVSPCAVEIPHSQEDQLESVQFECRSRSGNVQSRRAALVMPAYVATLAGTSFMVRHSRY